VPMGLSQRPLLRGRAALCPDNREWNFLHPSTEDIRRQPR
jgi:hypothetical protein